MAMRTLAIWLPLLRSWVAPVRGTARGELAALEHRIIADLGLLWCDLAYGQQGPPCEESAPPSA